MALLEHRFLDTIISVVAERYEQLPSFVPSAWMGGLGWHSQSDKQRRWRMPGRNFAWKIVGISSVVCDSISSVSISPLRGVSSVTF